MEGDAFIVFGVREEWQDLGDFEEAAGPYIAVSAWTREGGNVGGPPRSLTSMAEEKWDTPLPLTPLVHKVHLQVAKAIDLHRRRELRELVDLGFLRPPVEAIGPVLR